ncbi:MAG TPA: hypothetical protein VHJ78_12590 [Actinomycetota bacterium]|nr:hypothetical protein [Actinomycetota bacterium]
MAARLALGAAAALLALAACAPRPAPEPRRSATPSPPQQATLETARWEGTWEFNYTLVRLVGATEEETSFQPGNKIRRIWQVRPGCDDRPCNSEISATNPDDPNAGEVVSTVVYDNGVYRINQTFPPEVSNACRAADGRVIPQAFEATNTVEVTPEDFEIRDGRAVVTEMSAVKRTAFTPKGEAVDAGGTCEPKSAEWEATVTPVPD